MENTNEEFHSCEGNCASCHTENCENSEESGLVGKFEQALMHVSTISTEDMLKAIQEISAEE